MRLVVLISVFTCLLTRASVAQKAGSSVLIIPVVVHVLYNNAAQNISDDQIRSQLVVLNNDYRKNNTDAVLVPDAFKSVAGDPRIEFRLATTDPSGLSSTGIVRTSTGVPAFIADDKIKFSNTGGDDAWNRDEYLNIWIGNISGGILGYASVPGCAAPKDGVVIRYNVFGTTSNVQPPFNKGRTATHEIGHWLGLRHIWGDAPCGNDRIDDTPPQSGPTRGCPSGIVQSCSPSSSGNMYMNFMDFTDDACMNMFTNGQIARMHQLFSQGGERYALLFSDKAKGASPAVFSPGSANDISVYPNPAMGRITISLVGLNAANAKEATIYNHLGQVAGKIFITTREMTVDVSGLKGESILFPVVEKQKNS